MSVCVDSACHDCIPTIPSRRCFDFCSLHRTKTQTPSKIGYNVCAFQLICYGKDDVCIHHWGACIAVSWPLWQTPMQRILLVFDFRWSCFEKVSKRDFVLSECSLSFLCNIQNYCGKWPLCHGLQCFKFTR